MKKISSLMMIGFLWLSTFSAFVSQVITQETLPVVRLLVLPTSMEELSLRERIESLGFATELIYESDLPSADLTLYAAVIEAEPRLTRNGLSIEELVENQGANVLVLEDGVFDIRDDYGGTYWEAPSGLYEVEVLDNSHPITSDYGLGDRVRISYGGEVHDFGAVGLTGLPADFPFTKLAEPNGYSDTIVLGAYAPKGRVALYGVVFDEEQDITEEGLNIFDKALPWVTGGQPPEPGFEISVVPKPSIVVHAGGWNDSASLLLKSVNFFEGSISLNIESPPSSISIELSSDLVYLHEGGEANVGMNVSSTWAPLSVYTCVIVASSGFIEHELNFEIVVVGNTEAIQNTVSIEEVNLELNVWERRFRWCSIQQNFVIYTTDTTEIYWAQNIVGIALMGIGFKDVWVRSVFQVWERSPNRLVLNKQGFRPTRLSEPLVLNLTSYIEGTTLIMENDASPKAKVSFEVPEGSYIAAYKAAPEICLVGGGRTGITSTIASFEYPTRGQVQCYSKLVGEDAWRSTVNRVIGISESDTEEQSLNLMWWTDGLFLWHEKSEDQGISFAPNYETTP